MPDHGIKGKNAIITGAGRGIGRAVARRLAASGANVVIVSRTVSQLDETKRCIERDGGRVLAVVADVSREPDVERLVSEARATFGPVNILVNNAGIAPLAPIEQMEPPMFDHILATNVRAVYLCTRAVWPMMSEQGDGAIVNLSSMSAYDPFPGFAAYGAAKAFVNAYTKAMAAEGRDRGIRVYGVAPGAVDTQMLRGPFPDFPEEKALTPDEVAALIETLLTPACHYVSGETVKITRQ